MKKSIFILPALFILAAIVFVSCSKKGNHTCSCTWNLGGQSMSQDYPLNDMTESDAKDACEKLNATAAVGITASCKLK